MADPEVLKSEEKGCRPFGLYIFKTMMRGEGPRIGPPLDMTNIGRKKFVYHSKTI